MEHDVRPMRRVRFLSCHAALLVALGAALAFGGAVAPARAVTPPASGETRAKAAPSAPPGRMIVQWDHIIDSNDRTFEDFWGYLSYRRSTWSAFYRYRKDFDHVVEIDTEQIVRKGFVAAALLRGIHVIPDNAPDDRNQLQYGEGFDYYWGDYDFLSFRAISDPRQGGRWSFIASTRLYRGEPIYVQPGLVKHTDGSTGWFVQGKFKLFRWSAGKYNQFDWTEVDRTIYSAGLEWTY